MPVANPTAHFPALSLRLSCRTGKALLYLLVCGALQYAAPAALAQFTQQGPKLVGTGAVGSADQGVSVALSVDGNTAIVGGDLDNSATGAVWVFTRSNGVWTQQGPKLVGTGAVGSEKEQGFSIALSADGNTAIVGGFGDNSFAGAVWVFTRSNGVWMQQGPKLVGTGAVGSAQQGWSVALSADGNTAIVGGLFDNSAGGAAWVFTRSNGVWMQQGAKLSALARSAAHFKGDRSRCRPTATPPLSEGTGTIQMPARSGYSSVATGYGRSKA